jgi:hypothetical protein
LKDAVSGFYYIDDIISAKNQLLEDVKGLNLENLSTQIANNSSKYMENRSQMEVSDILLILSLCDYQGVANSLPIYVAKDLDFPELSSNELRVMKNGFDNMLSEQKMAAEKINLLENNFRVLNENILQSKGRKYKVQSSEHSVVQPSLFVVNNDSTHGHGSLDRDSSANFETADCEGDVPFEVAKNRKKKRKQAFSPSDVIFSSDDDTDSTIGNVNQQVDVQSRKGKSGCLLGKGSDIVKLSASKSLHKKAIFFVGNVAEKFEERDVVSHLEDLKINCVSCYKLKSQIVKENKDKQFRIKIKKPSNSFRVCIMTNDVDNFSNMQNWPNSVTIRPWVFKPKDSELNNVTMTG